MMRDELKPRTDELAWRIRVRVDDISPPPPLLMVLLIHLHFKMGLATDMENRAEVGHQGTHTAVMKSER